MDKIALLALKKSGAVDVGLAVAAKEAAEAAQEAAEDAAEELSETVEDVAELKTDVSNLKSQISAIADETISLGTDLKRYYGGQVGDTISYTEQNSSHGYAIDLSAYVGKTVRVYYKTTNASSTRVTALCDANDKIVDRTIEASMKSSGDGWLITPTETCYKLYVSGSSYSSDYSVSVLSPINSKLTNIGANAGETAYVDANAPAGGIGTKTSPYNDIQTAIDAGYNNLIVRSGEYSQIAALNLDVFKMRLWDMPDFDYETPDVPKIKIVNATAPNAVNIYNCRHVEISDVWVDSPAQYGFRIDKTADFTLTRCYANSNETSNTSLFRIDNSNGVINNCVAWGSMLDGFNIHGYGNTDIINCKAYNCGDDGASHHNGCTGAIIGGEYYGNGKAGLAPFSGAKINIYDVYCHDNTQYGIYCSATSSTGRTESIISGCTCKNNTTADIYVNYADAIGLNNNYDALTVGTNGTFNEVDGDLADLKSYITHETVYSKNLFNPNAEGVLVGKYLDTSGNPTTLAAWNTSDYIDVSQCESIVGSVWYANGTYKTYCKLDFLHTYNAAKQHIAKKWDTSANGVYTVEDGVAYIRFCWEPDQETQNGQTIMVESGVDVSDRYVPYSATNRTSLTDSAYPTFAETKTLINANGIDLSDNIVCWGDSLTYSQYSTNVRYPAKLAELTGNTVLNFGMPGASSMDISGLQGGMPIYVAPFTLPAASTDKVDVTLMDCNGYSDMYFGILHYSLIDRMSRVFTVDGIRVKLGYNGNNEYTLERYATAESATVFDRPVKLNIESNYFDYINVFWVGTNDAPNTAEKAQRTIDIIKNMVNHFGGKRYLVLGLTYKDYADETNDLMGQTFGNHYVDVKDYLIKYGLDDNNLQPSAQDETDISNSVVPTSLRYDSVHFNDYGYTAVANCVYRHGKDLGYW